MRAPRIFTASTIALTLAACTAYETGPQASPAPAAQAEPLYVRHTMQAEVNPAIVKIWDVGNNAMNDTGGLDAAQMSDALWEQLAEAAGELSRSGEKMAVAANIQAAAPGNLATEDYEVSMTNVQAYIDADPQGFRDMGAAFAQLSRSLEAAAQARNVTAAGELVSRMDTECSVCHARYWYAEAE